MILYLMIAALTTGIACLVDNKQSTAFAGNRQGIISRRQGINKVSLLFIFLILFLPAALRLEVGNDYESYVDTIHEIYVGGYVVTEPLFNLIVKVLCVLSGGENYLLVFAVFSFATIYIFLKVMMEQSESFPLAFFLFMTLGLYFRTYNTMRYYLVLAITLYSFRFIIRKEYIKFILLILLASTLHKSVLVVIPLYMIASVPWKKWMLLFLGTGSVIAVIFQDLIMKIALVLYPSYQNTIFLQQERGVGEHLFTLARCAAVLLLCLIFYKEALKEREENRFYLKLNVLAMVLYTAGAFLPLVGRIGYYLITSHMLLIPSVLMAIPDKKKKRIWTILVLAACTVYFLLFLRTADEAGVRVLPYKTWLFYEKEFLNAETIF